MSNNTFVYPLDGALYINLTNKCSNDCTFCIREGDTMSGFDLWLQKEPSAKEVIAQMDGYSGYKSMVFCGYGEPTYRLSQLLDVAKEAKKRGMHIRLNTNGLGSKINGRDISADLKGLIDIISVSLNAPDSISYDAVSRPKIQNSFDEMLDFVKKCIGQGIEVILTAVSVIGEEKAKECKKLADSLGAAFRLREYIQPENPSKK